MCVSAKFFASDRHLGTGRTSDMSYVTSALVLVKLGDFWVNLEEFQYRSDFWSFSTSSRRIVTSACVFLASSVIFGHFLGLLWVGLIFFGHFGSFRRSRRNLSTSRTKYACQCLVRCPWSLPANSELLGHFQEFFGHFLVIFGPFWVIFGSFWFGCPWWFLWWFLGRTLSLFMASLAANPLPSLYPNPATTLGEGVEPWSSKETRSRAKVLELAGTSRKPTKTVWTGPLNPTGDSGLTTSRKNWDRQCGYVPGFGYTSNLIGGSRWSFFRPHVRVIRDLVYPETQKGIIGITEKPGGSYRKSFGIS